MLEAAANAQQEPHIPWEWTMCWKAPQKLQPDSKTRHITRSQKIPPGPWQRWSPPCPSSQPTVAGLPVADRLVVQSGTKEDLVVLQKLRLFGSKTVCEKEAPSAWKAFSFYWYLWVLSLIFSNLPTQSCSSWTGFRSSPTVRRELATARWRIGRWTLPYEGCEPFLLITIK